MRISDWSSDVCSSDLRRRGHVDDKAHAREDEEQHDLARAPSAPEDIARTDEKVRDCGDKEAERRARRHPHHRRTQAEQADVDDGSTPARPRSEEHTSELPSLIRTSYAVFCFQKT